MAKVIIDAEIMRQGNTTEHYWDACEITTSAKTHRYNEGRKYYQFEIPGNVKIRIDKSEIEFLLKLNTD